MLVVETNKPMYILGALFLTNLNGVGTIFPIHINLIIHPLLTIVTNDQGKHPGWVLPYLGMVGRFRGDDPSLGDFQSDWVPILFFIYFFFLFIFFFKSLCTS